MWRRLWTLTQFLAFTGSMGLVFGSVLGSVLGGLAFGLLLGLGCEGPAIMKGEW